MKKTVERLKETYDMLSHSLVSETLGFVMLSKLRNPSINIMGNKSLCGEDGGIDFYIEGLGNVDVKASMPPKGKHYSAVVVETIENRYKNPPTPGWLVEDNDTDYILFIQELDGIEETLITYKMEDLHFDVAYLIKKDYLKDLAEKHLEIDFWNARGCGMVIPYKELDKICYYKITGKDWNNILKDSKIGRDYCDEFETLLCDNIEDLDTMFKKECKKIENRER